MVGGSDYEERKARVGRKEERRPGGDGRRIMMMMLRY
jgi:hypothetical protein